MSNNKIKLEKYIIHKKFGNGLFNFPNPNNSYIFDGYFPNVKSKNFNYICKLVMHSYQYPKCVDIAREYLNKFPQEVDVPIQYGYTALVLACINCNLYSSKEMVELLLEKNANINWHCKRGFNILHLLLDSYHPENIEIVKLILEPERKFNVNQFNEMGCNILHSACISNKIESLKLILLREDLNVNAERNDGCTALYLAAILNHKENFKLLLKHKDINVNSNKNDYSNTILFVACLLNYIDVVKSLLEHENTDVNAYAENGMITPLYIAVDKNHYDITKLLLEHKDIDDKVCHYTGLTAFLNAINNKNFKILELFINYYKNN